MPVPTVDVAASQWWTEGAFEAVPGTWITFDDDGVITDVRTRASFAYGEVARHELLGRRVTDVLDPVHAATVLAAVASAREGQPVEICEFEWAGPAGRRWYEARVARHDGVVVACVMDMHASHEERIANERAAAVMATIADTVVEIDGNTVTAVLGRGVMEPHPVVGQDLDRWLPEHAARQLTEVIDAVRTGGSGDQFSIVVDAAHVYEIAVEPRTDSAVVLVVRDRTDEHALRLAALVAQRRLADTLAAFPDLVIRLDVNGAIAEVIAGAGPDLIGPIERQLGFGYRSMMPEEALAAWDEGFARAVSGGSWAAAEYRLMLDQMPAWFEARFRRTADDEIVCVIRNKTIEHLLTDQAAANERKLRATMAALPDLVFTYRSDGTLVEAFVDREADLVAPIAQQIGQAVTDILPPSAAASVLGAIRDALATGEVVSAHYEVEVGGSPVWFEDRFAPVGTAEVVCVARNVTTARQAAERLIAEEARARATLEAIPDLVFRIGRDGTFLDFKGDANGFVLDPNEIIGSSVSEVVPSSIAGQVAEALHRVLDEGHGAEGDRVEFSFEFHIAGQTRRFEARCCGAGRDEAVILCRDVTEAQQAKAEAARAEAVLDASTDYVVIVDPLGNVVWANQAATTLLPMAGGRASDLFDTESKDIFAIEVVSEVDQSGMWRGEMAFDIGSGMSIPVSLLAIAGRDELSGQLDHIALIARDITEVREAHQRLTHLASHDTMTGLPNRALCMDRLRHASERAMRGESRYAVLFCDLDGFKAVNDELGHDAGDQVLIEVAARLKSAVRVSDTVARFGGDEFVVVCEGFDDRTQAEVIARRIISAIDDPVMTDAGVATVGVSIGLAHSGIHSDVDDVLRRADEAMYSAKAQGKGTLVVHPPR